MILLEIAKKHGWKGELLDYRNSGDTAGDRSSVVGYAAIAFYEPYVSDSDKRALLSLARRSVELYAREQRKPDGAPTLSAGMRAARGCFVTLKEHGQLRGCIGSLNAEKPLYECVAENAVNAAAHDPRFQPVESAELPQIEVEISVLTPPVPLAPRSPEQLLSELQPGAHGVILEQGPARSTFLPQVWEQLPDKRAFLAALCRKAGLIDLCWQSPSTSFSIYRAVVFHEERRSP